MKKMLSMLLASLMIVSLMFIIPAYASEITINAKDVIEGGQGVGFFDNTENSTATEPESAGDNQIYLRGGEWVKYSVSDHNLTPGTYEVSIKRRATAWARQRVFVDLYVDDNLALKQNIDANITTYSSMVLGKVYIGEDSEEIKLLNSGLYNDYYLWLESITFELISEDDITAEDYDIYFHAHNIKSIEKAESATSDGGFWDAAGLTLPNGNLIENLSYTQHAGDWTQYDISGLKPGTYSIYVEGCASSNPNMSMHIDGLAIYMDKQFATTGSYSVSREDHVARLYITGEEKNLKISTSSLAIFLRGIRFELESEDNLLLDTSLRIEAEISIPGGQGVAYWDNGQIPTRLDVLEINAGATGSTICHRTDEWVKYSVKNLLPGRYALTLSSASIVEVALSVELDDNVAINKYVIPKQTSYSDFKTNRIGFLDIETSDEIIMKVSHVNEGVATYIDYFELKRVEPLEIEGVATNISDDGVVTRGADVIVLKTTNELSSETYSNAKIKDESGKLLSADVVLGEDKKELIFNLKETLDYETEYEIDLTDVTDDFAQKYEGGSVSFITEDASNDAGEASLDSVAVNKNNKKTMFKGIVLSSSGLPIKGRKVTFNGKLPSGAEMLEKTAVTDENGIYEFEVSYEKSIESGAYTYTISTEYALEDKVVTDTFFAQNDNDEICDKINGKKTWEEAKEALITNASSLGIDALGSEVGIDMIPVYKKFVARNFDSASEIHEEFNRYIVVEKINQATDASEVASVIENKEEGSLLNIDYSLFDKLASDSTDENSKENVINKIFNAENISDFDDMAEFINSVIAEAFSATYSISSTEIEAIFPQVKEGSGGKISIAFSNRVKNAKKIHVELSYEDGTVFENEPVEIKSKIKGTVADVSFENKKINIDFDREYTLDDVKNICELLFTTLSGDEGEYDVKISGYVIFKTADGEAKIDFANKVSGVFEVLKATQSGKGDYSPSGGGGGGGSASTYPVISLPQPTEAPAQTEDAKDEVPKEIFSDLDDASWAKTSIITLHEMGVISGRGDGTFDPNAPVSRAEFLKILLGAQRIEASGDCDFNDVFANDWYYSYVSKASELGIVTGDENGYFNPNASITRQDMAVISYRLLEKTKNVTNKEPIFNDSNEISDYAKTAVGSLYEMGMISGVGDNNFAPKTEVTRAMASQFAYNMLYPKEKPTPEIPKEAVGDRAMSVALEGDKLAVRTSYDESYDLVQQFKGFEADNMEANGVINFANAVLTDKNETNIFAGGKLLSPSTDEATPFLINTSYIGANHGQSSAILVNGSHDKTYADIGSIWKDEAGAKFTLLKIEKDNGLLFLSDNVGTSKTNWSFVNEIKGDLEYVSDGVNKDNIKVSSATAFKQVFSATRLNDKAVYAVVDGVGYRVTNGVAVDCDYVDIVEKYDIINPATIGDSLRKNKPQGGYKENPSLATGEAIIAYSMIYRITPDGTVMSIFDHEITGDINFRSYGAIQHILRNDIYGGGVYLYLPKVGEFKAENGNVYNFSQPFNITSGDVPNVTVSSLYWDDEHDAPNRTISYMRDANGADITAFAGGYLPVDDAAIGKREEMVNASIMLYNTKKLYPYFADSKAFEKSGTKGASLKGAAYRKYADMTETLSSVGKAYTIPYENDLYIYVDYHVSGDDVITLPDNITSDSISLVEKSDNVSYEIADGAISVNVGQGKGYGYIVFKVQGVGYGTNTYSKTNYSEKFIVE